MHFVLPYVGLNPNSRMFFEILENRNLQNKNIGFQYQSLEQLNIIQMEMIIWTEANAFNRHSLWSVSIECRIFKKKELNQLVLKELADVIKNIKSNDVVRRRQQQQHFNACYHK